MHFHTYILTFFLCKLTHTYIHTCSGSPDPLPQQPEEEAPQSVIYPRYDTMCLQAVLAPRHVGWNRAMVLGGKTEGVYVCVMYVCMCYVCTVCMYVCMYVCYTGFMFYVCMFVLYVNKIMGKKRQSSVCMYVCMYENFISLYVWMYVCMYGCLFIR